MQKPSWKWILIFNLILDLPLAIITAVSITLLNRKPFVFYPDLLINIGIAFVIAFLLNVILPVPLITTGFAGIFRIKPHTIAESLVGTIPVCLILTFAIGLSLSAFNLFMASKNAPDMVFDFQAVWGSFTGILLPLCIIVYIVTFIMTPIGATIATNACRK